MRFNCKIPTIKKGKKMGEPYFERFDEVFEWQIIEALDKIKKE